MRCFTLYFSKWSPVTITLFVYHYWTSADEKLFSIWICLKVWYFYYSTNCYLRCFPEKYIEILLWNIKTYFFFIPELIFLKQNVNREVRLLNGFSNSQKINYQCHSKTNETRLKEQYTKTTCKLEKNQTSD